MMSPGLTDRGEVIRKLLYDHVARRLAKVLVKWEGRLDSQAKLEIKKARDKYRLEQILERGAACSASLVVATHIAKATHPDLKVKKVTNLNINFGELPTRAEVGSHLLPSGKSLADTTGDGAYNSAGYELYLLLDLEFEGKPLGEWLLAQDRDAIQAFAVDVDNDKDAASLASKYAELLVEKRSLPATDTRAKQVYWSVSGEPADDGGYHLLQPLFSSSLAHAVHQEINDARFGESNKETRQAWRDKKAHDGIYRDYRDLVARRLGGTKPQNISQLNSERGGINYLLASLPPQWSQDRPRQFLFIDSALQRFRRYEGVNELLEALLALLTGNPGPTMETRIKRERIERALGQSLAAFGQATRQLFQPGWTRDAECRLPLCERIWLDPERVELPLREQEELRQEDEDFIAAFEWKDWPDEVAHRFGNWLQNILLQHQLPVGDIEHAHWARQALIDAEWPAPMQRRARTEATGPEVAHG